MKKILLLATSALLLLAGCAKEAQLDPNGVEGGLQEVTFSASIPSEAATKAVADNDGEGAFVNRCIMEIYYGGELFSRQYAVVQSGQASFTTQLVANRTYDVAFWADHVEATTEAGLQVDNYYNTRSDSGLKAVALKGTYAGNIDARDAFALSKKYTVAQQGGTYNAVLRRPFAQINVITTDVATVAKVSDLKPDKVALTIKNAVTSYNVVDSTAVSGQTSDLTYTASVYGWDAEASECTLSMDYLFAEKSKSVIDIAWAATKSGSDDVEHSFTNIPYQRNYRTNIKGALLTTTGQWTVTVDPVWAGNGTSASDNWLVNYVTAYNIADGNAKMLAGAHYVNVLEPSDADTVNVKIPNTETTGNDYGVAISGTPTGSTVRVEELGTYSGTLGVTGPNTTNFQINCPNLSVTLNGEQQHDYSSVTAATAESTLFVGRGVTISDNLTITKGAAYIYGNVADVTLEPAEGCTASVKKWHVYNLDQFNKAIALPADTVVLEANITPTAAASVTNDVVIDLNGYNITAGSVGMIFNVDRARLDLIGTGVISNASIPVESGYYMIRVTGSAENTSSRPYRINVGENVTLNANGYAVQVLNATGSENSYGVYVNISSKQNTTGYALVTVNGNIHATEGNFPVVSLNKGVNLTSQGSAVYGAGYAQYQFIGGTYNCKETGAEIRAGIALFLDGCELTATDQPTSVTQNGSGSTSDGAAIAIAQHSTKLPVKVYIYGGSFTGYSALYESNPQGNDEESIAKVNMYVYGGKFKTNNGGQKVIYSQDCEKFITVSSSYTPAIFSIEPDAEYIADTYGVVANTDNATMATYPYTIAKGKLVGSGTVSDPYQVGTASDLNIMGKTATSADTKYYFKLTDDIEVKTDNFISASTVYGTVPAAIPAFKGSELDGDGHTITVDGVSDGFVIGELKSGVVRNLNIDFDNCTDASMVFYANAGNTLENVSIEGSLKWLTSNQGAFYDYFSGSQNLTECVNRATLQTKTGDVSMYVAVFFGYGLMSSGTVTMTDCSNEGSLVAGKASLIMSNWAYRTNENFVLSNVKNNGTIRSTCTSYYGGKGKYNYLTSDYWDKQACVSFTIDGSMKYTSSTTPKWYELEAQSGVLGTGSFIPGPEDATLALTMNADNTFTITPSTAAASYYVVSVGLYVGTASGSNRSYATETVMSGTTVTALKYLSFVDYTWVANNPSAVQGEIAGNTVYTLGDNTYYLVSSEGFYTENHEPEAPQMISVSAFDSNDILLASAPLTE